MAELNELYDDLRTTLMSFKYYSRRLFWIRRLNFIADWTIATSVSSAFTTLQLFKASLLIESIAPYLAAIVAMLTITKPLLAWDKEIERLSKLVAGYSESFEKLKRISARVAREEGISPEVRNLIRDNQSTIDKLKAVDDPNPNRSKLALCQTEVEEEIPISSLWWPSKNTISATKEV